MKNLFLFKWFSNISIARKLYFTVGIMGVLIGVELFTLFFSINTLSSVRAYVEGEGLWSKAQKDAVSELRKYGHTHDEKDYQAFIQFMQVPMGDGMARRELAKATPDLEVARQGFIQGRNHPDDVDGMIKLMRRFNWISYIHRAIELWSAAEPIAYDLVGIGEKLHAEINSKSPSDQNIESLLAQIEPLNKRLTGMEDDFSYTLGDGSRWLEHVVLRLLFAVALTVEITGILLAISVSRGMRNGLSEIIQATKSFMSGNFHARTVVLSNDEIGLLARSFNKVAERFENSLKELEVAERKFRGLLESAPDAIIIVDNMGIIKLVNVQAEKNFEWDRKAIIGKSFEMLVPGILTDEHFAERINYFQNKISKTERDSMYLTGKKLSGKEFQVEISLSPLHTEEGLLIMAAIRDITERREAEAALRKYNHELEVRNKELAQFAYVASHDLQEPLRTVSSFVELLQRDFEHTFDENGKLYMNIIVGSAHRMRDQIKALLDYVRIGRDHKPQQADLNDILNDTIKDMNSSIEESHAVIELEPLPVVHGYTMELKLLFQNLLSNAIKFRKPGQVPVIKVGVDKTATGWLFYVRDNGIGIEERFLKRIFIIFQRLHTRDEYPGTGIGLAHCQKIVELHGGEIWAESEINKGSTFYFTLPFHI